MHDPFARRESARRALFEGKLDVEGMDNVLDLYRDLFQLNDTRVLSEVDLRGMTVDESRMRLAEAFTLLDPGALLPGADEVTAMVREVVRVLDGHSDDPEGLRQEMAVLLADPLRLRELARTYLTEGEERLRDGLLLIEGTNHEVAMFVLFNALKGSFLEAAERCSEVEMSAWEQGYCPVCGGEPAVAYLMGEGGRRYLICHRCETHWPYRRLQCPFCGFQDPGKSGFLFSEDPAYRSLSASVCEQCRTYIKGWRIEGDELGDIHPEIEDLKTPGFDQAVEEEGYSRGAPNIFGVWIGTVAEEVENPL